MPSQRDMIMMDVEGESELDLESVDLEGTCRACTEKLKQNIGSFQKAAEEAALKRMLEALETTSIASRYCCGGELVEEVPRVGICFGDLTSDKKWRANLPMETEHTKRGHTDMVKRLHQACDDNGRIEQHQKINAKSTSTNEPIIPNPSSNYFGTLAIFLPHRHKGKLAQRNNISELTTIPGGKWEISIDGDETQVFKWHRTFPKIGWLAFRGDYRCNVWPADDGIQLVLIYHLTLRVSTATIATVLDPPSIPIYQIMRKKVDHPSFMNRGGVLGFHPQHGYDHTKLDAHKSYP
ncbi:hypothetical protein L207DRAFT_590178 [Hyaloscypha variabilis F]|uniref:Uncharacterized protein n=1 Tax=Hyaloscypha variabilis (strain UAMH 11265 / GT02V1 / F) TaxID=1149755 RepID=A0A2J6R3J7_HYAVF|nr:hypothetical protein L207DRAFT_590178 [Hyaloscypha variabilis F]